LISYPHLLTAGFVRQNIGRRRYPSYWFSGKVAIVQDRRGGFVKESLDEAEMEAEEGRSRAMELGLLPEGFDEESISLDEENRGGPGQASAPKELLRGRRFSRRF
jgi:hypothetical protein